MPGVRDTETARVAKALRERITDQTLASGQRLVERAIADEFGVSRLPVRQALRALAREGLVDVRPRGGSVVHTFTLVELADLSELLPAFDLLANRQAAMRRTASDLPTLRAAADVCVAAVRTGDSGAIHAAGLGFRRAVYRASRDRALQDVNRAFDGRLGRLMLPNADPDRSIALYEGLYAAIEAGDPGAAAAALEQFLAAFRSSNRERMIDALDGHAGADSVRSILPAPTGASPAEDSRTAGASTAFTSEAERVLRCLRRQIVLGERSPGDPLSERDISKEFSVSRIPVSEAIFALVAEGVVWPGTSRASARVRGITSEEAEDLVEVAAALSAAALQLAAQRATPAGIAALESLLRSQYELNHRGEGKAALIDSIFEFRDILHRMSANSLVLSVDSILDSRLRMLSHSVKLDESPLRAERLAIDALITRDPVLAGDVVRGFAAGPARRILDARGRDVPNVTRT